MTRTYIVRKVLFRPNREEQKPFIVEAQNALEATEKIKNHDVDGELVQRGDGVFQGHHSFDLKHLTDILVEVIPVV